MKRTFITMTAIALALTPVLAEAKRVGGFSRPSYSRSYKAPAKPVKRVEPAKPKGGSSFVPAAAGAAIGSILADAVEDDGDCDEDDAAWEIDCLDQEKEPKE